MATRRAILIGVDGYRFSPLTSAVKDAIAMRDALVSRTTPGLPPVVREEDVTLLATPGPGEPPVDGAAPATRDAILGALRPHWESRSPVDFLLVYFAGHGLAVSPDDRVRHTLILPSDVAGPEEGRNMISVTELLALFSERGPMQQVWIIDACRDMRYERRPRGYDVEWPTQDPQGPRAQVAIYAVAQGGEALSALEGQGRFTSHLLRGLDGAGSAADYVAGRGHCVTAQSLHEYARRRVSEALEGFDDWTRTIQEPQITPTSRPLDPLRDLPAPAPRAFRVTLRPPEAEPAVDVLLEVQLGLPVAGWPPAAPPRIYELRAALKPGMDAAGWGDPAPALRTVDLREQDSAIVDVPRRPGPDRTEPAAPPRPTTGERGIARAQTVKRDAASGFLGPKLVAPRLATLTVVHADAVARVHLRRAEAPWDERDASGNQPVDLAPGVWDVTVRLGDEIVSATRVVLTQGEQRTVEAVAQITPATSTLLPPATALGAAGGGRMILPALGHVQGAILPTLLPLLALKPFDSRGGVLSGFEHLLSGFEHLRIPLLARGEIPEDAIPFVVAVAIDGTRTEPVPIEVSSARRLWVGPDSRVSLFVGWQRGERGSVTVVAGSRHVNVAAPALARGVTVVSVTSWPTGRFDASTGIFRLPPGSRWDDSPPSPGATEALARALAVASPLFCAGANIDEVSDPMLTDIAFAKWLDPVLGVIAFHAHDRRLGSQAAPLNAGTREYLTRVRGIVRDNLTAHFLELPDCRIVAALDPDDEDVRRRALLALLDDASLTQPVLTASLAHLANAAIDAGRDDHWAVDRMERITPGQVFNVVRVS